MELLDIKSTEEIKPGMCFSCGSPLADPPDNVNFEVVGLFEHLGNWQGHTINNGRKNKFLIRPVDGGDEQLICFDGAFEFGSPGVQFYQP